MMCNNEEDCIEFVAKADKPKIHVAVTPYIGLQKYTSHDDLKEYGKPVLTYLVGVNAAVSCPRWISSLSLVVDLSVSKLSAKDTRRKSDYSSILLSGKLGGGYTFPRGAVRPFIGAGAVVCGFLSAKYKIGNTRLEPFGGAFPGYYVNLGLLIPVSKKMATCYHDSCAIRRNEGYFCTEQCLYRMVRCFGLFILTGMK